MPRACVEVTVTQGHDMIWGVHTEGSPLLRPRRLRNNQTVGWLVWRPGQSLSRSTGPSAPRTSSRRRNDRVSQRKRDGTALRRLPLREVHLAQRRLEGGRCRCHSS